MDSKRKREIEREAAAAAVARQNSKKKLLFYLTHLENFCSFIFDVDAN